MYDFRKPTPTRRKTSHRKLGFYMYGWNYFQNGVIVHMSCRYVIPMIEESGMSRENQLYIVNSNIKRFHAKKKYNRRIISNIIFIKRFIRSVLNIVFDYHMASLVQACTSTWTQMFWQFLEIPKHLPWFKAKKMARAYKYPPNILNNIPFYQRVISMHFIVYILAKITDI